jgi:2-C-methyl-D-erythritol 4-phosphate cytidylyltransferase
VPPGTGTDAGAMNVRPLVGVVAAAGDGERLGQGKPKALVACAGRPLVEWSIGPLAAVCDRVVVAMPPGIDEVPWTRDAGQAERVTGGASRSESVLAGVRASPEARAYVVHDAARPLVTRALVERCVGEVGHGWDGAVAAAPMTDTVKEASAAGEVVQTLDRATLWAVQTPQAFQASALRRALDVAPALLASATDDASLVEAAGGRVRVVDSSPENLKVTRPRDLAAAEAVLAARAGRGES